MLLTMALAARLLPAGEGAAGSAKRPQGKVLHSAKLGWRADEDVTGRFAAVLAGELADGGELVLDHRYRIRGSHTLPDGAVLSAVKGAGLDVTDAAKPESNRPLLALGNGTTVRNLTIRYLDTPKVGPTGEKHGVHFTRRLGLEGRGKRGLRIENCRLTGSIGHHIKLMDCREVEVVGCHVAGGHWSIVLTGVSELAFRRCVVEKCQGDGIKTGGGASGAVRKVVVERCLFQDNLRDGIDTTGGFNDAVVRNCIFRRLGVSGMDIKAHYESKTGRIEDLAPENIGIRVERCLFHDMPNAFVITTLDCGRRDGKGKELLTAENMKKYAPHDIEVVDCVIGHAEKPLRSAQKGGYGVNYPSDAGEHMRMLFVKDGYDIRYRGIRLSGERIMPVHIRSIGGSRHLSKEAAEAIKPTVTGTVVEEPAPPIKPGVTEVPFPCGPRELE